MSSSVAEKVDKQKIRKAIEVEAPLIITTYTLPHDMEVYIGEVISCFLKMLNQEDVTEYVNYCISELTTNAKKANTKRVYFKEKQLDLNDKAQYDIGMKSFKNDTLGNLNHYLVLQKEAGLYVKVIIQKKANTIKFEVRNNCELTKFEEERMKEKIENARQYNSMQEALNYVIDETEGAGLGIIIMILMLRKIGVTDKFLQFYSENGETITRFVINLSDDTKYQLNAISEDIVLKIDNLSHFPENITKINELLDDKESKLSDIADLISKDVSLTTDLLKIVNSTAFGHYGRCQNIQKAVSMVGIKGIKNMLYSVGSLKALSDDTDSAKEIWTHSNKIAFFSYNLCKNFFPNRKELLDVIYVCGLLHDIGKIIIYCHRDDMEKMYGTLCCKKNIPKVIFEQLAAGVNHAEIGAMMAEKWNFPTVIVEAIRYHHRPDFAPPEFKDLTEIIYIADMLNYLHTGEVELYQVDEDILKKYQLDSVEKIEAIFEKLETAFSEMESQNF
ncbi:MAG: HDOD domain-containing protein [Treponemataceae bacterium]